VWHFVCRGNFWCLFCELVFDYSDAAHAIAEDDATGFWTGLGLLADGRDGEAAEHIELQADRPSGTKVP
jgi:hypothetical protein